MYELLVSLLTFNPSNFTFYGVTLNNSVVYSGTTLPITGFGMGGKKTGPTVTKVAVNQLFTQYPDRFVRTENGALDSLSNVGLITMSITFLRGVDSDSVESSIAGTVSSNMTRQEALDYHEDIDQVADAIRTDSAIYSGQTVNVIANVSTGLLLYMNSSGKITPINSRNGFVKKVFSAWFGNAADQASYNLKMALLNKPELKTVK
jgi:hypothetical protein